jgi:prepilin-type N-terminal cleavage/methylation domain-containing protein
MGKVSSVVNSLRFARGFTLLEILIVTIIIALVASIGIPRFIGSIERAQVKSTAGEIANVMRLARLKAVSEKKIVTVEVDTEKRIVRAMYSGDGNEMAAEPIKIPASISLLTGSPGGFYNRPMSFEFNPTGGATGGDLLISPASAKVMEGKGYIVRLKPLSGKSIVIPADEL